MADKIAIVIQRYGLEINGGAELLCRQLAERLKLYYDIDVFTTKAIDHISWENEFKKDEEWVNGIHVFRFPVEKKRELAAFGEINYRYLHGELNETGEEEFLEIQGPFTPTLIQNLIKKEKDYKVILFFTYLYYPFVYGLKSISQKSIAIPTAHDEPYIYMKIFKDIFLKPNAFIFLTEEERDFVQKIFNNSHIPSEIGGIGVEISTEINAKEFYSKYGVTEYIVYVGRIETGKNCDVLFDYFLEYKKRNVNNLKLVLMGKEEMPVPKSDSIISLGFVSDEDKINGIAGAKALIMPSEFESLSMVVLEAMSIETPVIVNEKCPVLKGHCIKSNGALYYNNFFEFEGEINYIEKHPEVVEAMTKNAKQYVEENYQWDNIIKKLQRLIQQITS